VDLVAILAFGHGTAWPLCTLPFLYALPEKRRKRLELQRQSVIEASLGEYGPVRMSAEKRRFSLLLPTIYNPSCITPGVWYFFWYSKATQSCLRIRKKIQW
jgi:hypothetical protein